MLSFEIFLPRLLALVKLVLLNFSPAFPILNGRLTFVTGTPAEDWLISSLVSAFFILNFFLGAAFEVAALLNLIFPFVLLIDESLNKGQILNYSAFLLSSTHSCEVFFIIFRGIFTFLSMFSEGKELLLFPHEGEEGTLALTSFPDFRYVSYECSDY